LAFKVLIRLSIKTKAGATLHVVQPGLTVSAYETKVSQTAQKQALDNKYSFTLWPEQQAAFFSFNHMDNLPAFESFLDSMFTTLHQQKTENLIIDMRQNGGGNSALGEALFRYITDKPVAQFVKMDMKISLAVKQKSWYKQMGLTDTLSAGKLLRITSKLKGRPLLPNLIFSFGGQSIC
jgi:hypothetical protein